MAGLINQQMAGASAGDEQSEQEKMQGTGPDDSQRHEGMEGEQPEMNDESGATEESDPNYKQALQYAYEVLYKNDAAVDVAKQLQNAPSLDQGMADVAYNITSIIDEKTNGSVPDELLGVLGMRVLEEIGEIADAAGLDPQPQDIAEALKDMILRFLGEQGVDTTQLQQAMDQVDPNVFKQAAEQQA